MAGRTVTALALLPGARVTENVTADARRHPDARFQRLIVAHPVDRLRSCIHG